MNKADLKRAIMARLPRGALRELVPGGTEDLLYDALAEGLVDISDFLGNLAETREPKTTTSFADIEREYGFIADTNLSEEERRNRVAALKYAKRGTGTAWAMQDALHLAGFTQLQVVGCRQDQDPRLVSVSSKEFVVNGFEYLSETGYAVRCTDGLVFTCTSDLKHTCGGLTQIQIPIPYDPTSNWNMVFFVGSDIVVDGDGYVTSMTAPSISRIYRDVIREIILRIKPNGTWGLLAVDWAETATRYGFGFFPMGITAHGL